MKTTEQILNYISEYYRVAIERPADYFRNADSMESELAAFESLYEFIVNDAREFSLSADGLSEFLFKKGYGTLGFGFGPVDDAATKEPMRGPSSEEQCRMREFAEFWREYISSRTAAK